METQGGELWGRMGLMDMMGKNMGKFLIIAVTSRFHSTVGDPTLGCPWVSD